MSRKASVHREQLPAIAVMFPPSVGGTIGKVFSAGIIKTLGRLSRRIYVIATLKPRFTPEAKVHVIQMKGYGDEEPLLAKGLKFFLIGLKGCFHLLRISREVDVVIFHIGSGLYLLPLIVANLLGKKTIFNAAGLYSQMASHRYQRDLFGLGGLILPPMFKMLERITFSLTGRIIVESDSVIDSLQLNRYRKKVSVACMPLIDTEKVRARRDLDKRDLIGYIGRLGGEKGVVNFAKAIGLISQQRRGLRFLMGGDGPLLDEIRHELKISGTYDITTLTGWIPHSEMAGYLGGLKLFVLPSYTEGLPSTVLEAMACGTPVVTTPVGGIPDVIRDGETGFIMQDNSPECIARNVIRVLDDPNLDEIIQNARALVQKDYTYEVAVERYREILSNLLSKH